MATQRIKKAKAKISPKRSKKISAGEQNKINKGQRKINGALCYVDWHVIYSIKELIKALEDGGVLTEAKLKKAKRKLTWRTTRARELPRSTRQGVIRLCLFRRNRTCKLPSGSTTSNSPLRQRTDKSFTVRCLLL